LRHWRRRKRRRKKKKKKISLNVHDIEKCPKQNEDFFEIRQSAARGALLKKPIYFDYSPL
jgi:hypothetical protein